MQQNVFFMKHSGFLILPLLLALMFGAAGCGNKSDAASGDLQKGFSQADATTREEVEKVDAALKARNYREVVTRLNQLLQRHKLTETEKKAAQAVFGEITKAVAEDPALDSPEFYRARGELMKKLYGEF